MISYLCHLAIIIYLACLWMKRFFLIDALNGRSSLALHILANNLHNPSCNPVTELMRFDDLDWWTRNYIRMLVTESRMLPFPWNTSSFPVGLLNDISRYPFSPNPMDALQYQVEHFRAGIFTSFNLLSWRLLAWSMMTSFGTNIKSIITCWRVKYSGRITLTEAPVAIGVKVSLPPPPGKKLIWLFLYYYVPFN